MPEIIAKIDADGRVKMQGEGFVGTQCHDHVSALQKVLGAKTFQRDHDDHERAPDVTVS